MRAMGLKLMPDGFIGQGHSDPLDYVFLHDIDQDDVDQQPPHFVHGIWLSDPPGGALVMIPGDPPKETYWDEMIERRITIWRRRRR